MKHKTFAEFDSSVILRQPDIVGTKLCWQTLLINKVIVGTKTKLLNYMQQECRTEDNSLPSVVCSPDVLFPLTTFRILLDHFLVYLDL